MLSHRNNQGFTVLELLVSAAIGLILIATSFSFLSTGEQASTRQTARSHLITTTQTATRSLNYDLKMAGHYGGAVKGQAISNLAKARNISATSCVGRVLDLNYPIFGQVGANGGLCDFADIDADSDRLVLSYASHSAYSKNQLKPKALYLMHGASYGELLTGSEALALTAQQDNFVSFRELNILMYYVKRSVSDQPPALVRAKLYNKNGDFEFYHQVIATGVEALAFSLVSVKNCELDICQSYQVNLPDSNTLYGTPSSKAAVRMVDYEILVRSNIELLAKPRDFTATLRSNAKTGSGGRVEFSRPADRFGHEYIAQSVAIENYF